MESTAVESVSLEREYFVKLRNRIAYNCDVADLYYRMAEREPYDIIYRDEVGISELSVFDDDEVTIGVQLENNPFGAIVDKSVYVRKRWWGKHEQLMRKAEAVRSCLKYWDLDYYRLHGIKDIRRVNLCHDKFCLNCQCALSDKRQFKYEPLLESFTDRYLICHCVFTVPNVSAGLLKLMIKKMTSAFSRLNRYLKGDARVRGVNFSKYGYGGGLRALEVTYNPTYDNFHPHFHCMLLFRKDCADRVLENRINYNTFSMDYYGKKPVHAFTDMEILFQKVWYLLIRGERVTQSAIMNLREGYSVRCDVADGNYHEVFKYAIKGAFDDEFGAFLYDDEIFETLYRGLDSYRMIQGYGVLRGCVSESEKILDDLAEDVYNAKVIKLREVEEPLKVVQTLGEIVNDEDCSYMSKMNIRRLLSADMQSGRVVS